MHSVLFTNRRRENKVEGNVRFEKVSFFYRRDEDEAPVPALDRVSLRIESGKLTAVIGHNGSGKSTLAKQINALLIPTEGVVLTCGMDTREEDLVWEIRQNAGMIFQNPDNQLVASIVEDDVAFGPENLGIPPEEIRRRVDESLAEVGMSEFLHREPHHLSGGQKQRIAIAGVIAMRPRIIIMDEPTAMLDPKGRKEVLQTAKELVEKEGLTVVLITHFMEEALQADKVIVMSKGKRVMEGTPKEIFTQVDTLKALSLEVPMMAELANRLREDGVPVPDDVMTVEGMVNALCPLLQ